MTRPDLDHLQPPLRAALQAASDDLQRQGILLDSHITSGYRSTEHQAELYAARFTNPNPVARPGTSPHEFGMAVDIQRGGWGDDQWQAVQDTLHRYGMSRPLGERDPVHWQLTNPGQAAHPEPPGPKVFPQVNIQYQPQQAQQAQQQPGQYPTDGTMIPFASTMLAAAGYRAEVKELICEFQKTGRVYTYLAVPEDVWVGLVEAGSKGEYMRQLVIGVYPF